VINGTASEYRQVREAYDEAFRRWSDAVRSGDGDGSVVAEYRQRRDALAEAILASERNRVHRAAVERIAYSLWDKAGRPAGTSESDWYRAEAIFNNLVRQSGLDSCAELSKYSRRQDVLSATAGSLLEAAGYGRNGGGRGARVFACAS
jgi:hypothetical protein